MKESLPGGGDEKGCSDEKEQIDVYIKRLAKLSFKQDKKDKQVRT